MCLNLIIFLLICCSLFSSDHYRLYQAVDVLYIHCIIYWHSVKCVYVAQTTVLSCLSVVRDFAYVARDRGTRRHMCHVFRCELPARHIANTLCEICKKVIAQRAATAQTASGSGQKSRPSDLPNLHRVGTGTGDNIKFENLLKSEYCFVKLIILWPSSR